MMVLRYNDLQEPEFALTCELKLYERGCPKTGIEDRLKRQR